jgi:hypothetical protein
VNRRKGELNRRTDVTILLRLIGANGSVDTWLTDFVLDINTRGMSDKVLEQLVVVLLLDDESRLEKNMRHDADRR